MNNPHPPMEPPRVNRKSEIVNSPRQRSFCFDIRAHRPLCSVNAAMTLLGMREDAILDFIEMGHLQYAFNIATAGARKREIRILMASINAFQNGFRAPLTRGEEAAALDTILEGLFRHSRPYLRLSEIYDALNCSSQHALDLLRDGCFDHVRVSPCISPSPSVSVRVSPIVHRSTVITFLKSRRLT